MSNFEIQPRWSMKKVAARILPLSVALLIAFSGDQALGQLNKGHDKATSLGLRVTTKVSSVCYADDLSMKVELKNKSREKIAINTQNLWSFITFRAYTPSRFDATSAEVFMLTPSILAHPNDDFVTLKPGQVFRSTKVVPLNNQFFKGEKEVEFDVSYQQLDQRKVGGVSLWIGLITSNRLRLRISTCEPRVRAYL